MIRLPENFLEQVKEVWWPLALFQEELAHALGASFATANHWENGKNAPSKLVRRHFLMFCADQVKKGKLVVDEVKA